MPYIYEYEEVYECTEKKQISVPDFVDPGPMPESTFDRHIDRILERAKQIEKHEKQGDEKYKRNDYASAYLNYESAMRAIEQNLAISLHIKENYKKSICNKRSYSLTNFINSSNKSLDDFSSYIRQGNRNSAEPMINGLQNIYEFLIKIPRPPKKNEEDFLESGFAPYKFKGINYTVIDSYVKKYAYLYHQFVWKFNLRDKVNAGCRTLVDKINNNQFDYAQDISQLREYIKKYEKYGKYISNEEYVLYDQAQKLEKELSTEYARKNARCSCMYR